MKLAFDRIPSDKIRNTIVDHYENKNYHDLKVVLTKYNIVDGCSGCIYDNEDAMISIKIALEKGTI